MTVVMIRLPVSLSHVESVEFMFSFLRILVVRMMSKKINKGPT